MYNSTTYDVMSFSYALSILFKYLMYYYILSAAYVRYSSGIVSDVSVFPLSSLLFPLISPSSSMTAVPRRAGAWPAWGGRHTWYQSCRLHKIT